MDSSDRKTPSNKSGSSSRPVRPGSASSSGGSSNRPPSSNLSDATTHRSTPMLTSKSPKSTNRKNEIGVVTTPVKKRTGNPEDGQQQVFSKSSSGNSKATNPTRPTSFPTPLSKPFRRPVPDLRPISADTPTPHSPLTFPSRLSSPITSAAGGGGMNSPTTTTLVFGKKSAPPPKRPIPESSPESSPTSNISKPSTNKRLDKRSSFRDSKRVEEGSEASRRITKNVDNGSEGCNQSTKASIITLCDPEEAWKVLLAFHANTKQRRTFNRIARNEHYLTSAKLGAEESNQQMKEFLLSEMAFVLDGVMRKFTKQQSMEESGIGKFKYDAAVDIEAVVLNFLQQIRKRFKKHSVYLDKNFDSKLFTIDEPLHWSDEEKEKKEKLKLMPHKTYKLKHAN